MQAGKHANSAAWRNDKHDANLHFASFVLERAKWVEVLMKSMDPQ